MAKLWNPNRWTDCDPVEHRAEASTTRTIAVVLEDEPAVADAVVLARALKLARPRRRRDRRRRPGGLNARGPAAAAALPHLLPPRGRRGTRAGTARGLMSPSTVPRRGTRLHDGPVRADTIEVEIDIVGPDDEVETRRIPADFAVLNPKNHWPNEYHVLVAREHPDLDVPTLAALIENSCFNPRTGPDQDAVKTQQDRFQVHALEVAERTLVPAEATERRLRRTALDALRNLLGPGGPDRDGRHQPVRRTADPDRAGRAASEGARYRVRLLLRRHPGPERLLGDRRPPGLPVMPPRLRGPH